MVCDTRRDTTVILACRDVTELLPKVTTKLLSNRARAACQACQLVSTRMDAPTLETFTHAATQSGMGAQLLQQIDLTHAAMQSGMGAQLLQQIDKSENMRNVLFFQRRMQSERVHRDDWPFPVSKI